MNQVKIETIAERQKRILEPLIYFYERQHGKGSYERDREKISQKYESRERESLRRLRQLPSPIPQPDTYLAIQEKDPEVLEQCLKEIRAKIIRMSQDEINALWPRAKRYLDEIMSEYFNPQHLERYLYPEPQPELEESYKRMMKDINDKVERQEEIDPALLEKLILEDRNKIQSRVQSIKHRKEILADLDRRVRERKMKA